VDARTWTLALNSLLLAGATCAVSVPVGAVLAWLLWRTDLPGRRPAIGLLAMTLFVPLYLQAAAWQAGFGVQGWFTLATGMPAAIQGWPGAIWIHAMAAVPWVVLIVGVGLRWIEPELEEQALLDGSTRQVFGRVTLPGAAPAIGVATLWVAVSTAGEMTVSDLFRIRTYAEEVYTNAAVGPQVGEGPPAIGPGVVLSTALILATLVLCSRLLPGDRPLALRKSWVFRLGRWRLPLAIVAVAALAMVVGVPLGSLCYKAGVVVAESDVGRVRIWSPWKCLALVATSPWYYRREFGWSLLIGTLAATAAVAVAIPLGWLGRAEKGSRRRRLPRRAANWALLALTAICLAIPGPVIGVLIIRLLNRPEFPLFVWLYDRSIFGPWLAMFIRCLPPAVLVMWYALASVPDDVLEAAAVDGAGPLGRLFRIALPNRLAAAGLAWVVALAVALGDLGASILVVPPGVRTLAIRIFGQIHSGVEYEVAAVCIAQALMFAAAAILAARLLRVWTRTASP